MVRAYPRPPSIDDTFLYHLQTDALRRTGRQAEVTIDSAGVARRDRQAWDRHTLFRRWNEERSSSLTARPRSTSTARSWRSTRARHAFDASPARRGPRPVAPSTERHRGSAPASRRTTAGSPTSASTSTTSPGWERLRRSRVVNYQFTATTTCSAIGNSPAAAGGSRQCRLNEKWRSGSTCRAKSATTTPRRSAAATLVWEMPNACAAPIELDARMEPRSILYTTLWLFGTTFVAVALAFASVWIVGRRPRNATNAPTYPTHLNTEMRRAGLLSRLRRGVGR